MSPREIVAATGPRIDRVGLAERTARRVLYWTLGRLDHRAQTALTGFLKSLRRYGRRPGPEEPLIAGKGGGEVAVCLTHDLDWPGCWAFLPKLVELERHHGFRSTINVLTKGPYAIDRGFLAELAADGFEIGLHGRRHDIALGFRRRSIIRESLLRARDEVGLEVQGFRAPALSASEVLLEELSALGFGYDSSLAGWKAGLDVGSGPYRYPGLGIIEVPITLSDDRLFRDFRLEERDALDVFEHWFDLTAANGGVFVLNTHPGLLALNSVFWDGVLQRLNQQGAAVGPVAGYLAGEGRGSSR